MVITAFFFVPASSAFAESYPDPMIEEDFDSLNTAGLSGQDGWVCSGGNIQVEDYYPTTGKVIFQRTLQGSTCYKETDDYVETGVYSLDVNLFEAPTNSSLPALDMMLLRDTSGRGIRARVDNCGAEYCDLKYYDAVPALVTYPHAKIYYNQEHRINIVFKTDGTKLYMKISLDENEFIPWWETYDGATPAVNRLRFDISAYVKDEMYVDNIGGIEFWTPGGLPQYYEIPPQDSSRACGVNLELDSIYMQYVYDAVTYDIAFKYKIWQQAMSGVKTVKVTTQRLYAYRTGGATCYHAGSATDLVFDWFSIFLSNKIYRFYRIADLTDLFCDGYGDYWVRLEIVNDDGKCYSAPFRVAYSSDDPADASWTGIIAELPPEELGHLEKLLLPYVGWLESVIRENATVLMGRFPLNWVSGLYNDLSNLVNYEPGATTYLSLVLEVDYLDEEVLDVDMLPISDLVDGSSGLGEDFTDFISTIRSIIIFMTWITLGLYIFRRVSSFISGLSGVESGGITSTGSGGSTNWG